MKNCYNCKYYRPILDAFKCTRDKEVEQVFHKPVENCKFYEKGEWFWLVEEKNE